MGRVIAIANQKGGVGKTTTAINLAACVGRASVPVLIVDFDPQSNATSGLGQAEASATKNIYRVITGQDSAEAAIIDTGFPNVHLVASTHDLSGAEVEFSEQNGRYSVLKSKLEPVVDRYGFVFIDCPPALSLLTVNALNAAHSVLIPVQCEYYALEGLTQLLRVINVVRKRLNPVLKTEGFLLTMSDARTNLSRQVERDVRAFFGDGVFTTTIPRSVRLSEAPSFGKPIIEYDPRSTGAACYTALAEELLRGRPERSSPESGELEPDSPHS